jgi:hypothetical protein
MSSVVAFQLALALGAPWGSYAMGGKFPGKYPPHMRFVSVVQAVILALIALVALSRVDLALPQWSSVSVWLIWAVVAFSAVIFVLNLITPSAGERRIWVPVTFLLLICSIVVAIEAGQ